MAHRDPPTSVDWNAVDRRLPIACTPAGQEERQRLFDSMDPNGNGLLTLTEVNAGLPGLVASLIPTRNYRPAIKCAFQAARHVHAVEGKPRKVKKANDMVDREEFHALLFAFRLYLELDLVFESIDTDGDRMLCFKECEAALPKLQEWGFSRAQVKSKFPGDEWAETLKYENFASWCISRRMGGLELKLDQNDAFETMQAEAGGGDDAGMMMKAFEKWDIDANGSIAEDELATVLQGLDPTFTPEMAKELFAAADVNKDGKIDYNEFSKWLSQ